MLILIPQKRLLLNKDGQVIQESVTCCRNRFQDRLQFHLIAVVIDGLAYNQNFLNYHTNLDKYVCYYALD